MKTKPETYSVVAFRPEDEGQSRAYAVVYDNQYAMHAWIMGMIGCDEYKVVTDKATGQRIIVTDTGTTIKGTATELEPLLAYVPDHEDKQHPMPEDVYRMIRRFKVGVWDITDKPAVEKTAREPKPVREKRPDRPDGFITITQLAEELGLIPRIARGILRDSGLKKPAFGWAWAKKDTAPIVKLLKGATK